MELNSEQKQKLIDRLTSNYLRLFTGYLKRHYIIGLSAFSSGLARSVAEVSMLTGTRFTHLETFTTDTVMTDYIRKKGNPVSGLCYRSYPNTTTTDLNGWKELLSQKSWRGFKKSTAAGWNNFMICYKYIKLPNPRAESTDFNTGFFGELAVWLVGGPREIYMGLERSGGDSLTRRKEFGYKVGLKELANQLIHDAEIPNTSFTERYNMKDTIICSTDVYKLPHLVVNWSNYILQNLDYKDPENNPYAQLDMKNICTDMANSISDIIEKTQNECWPITSRMKVIG